MSILQLPTTIAPLAEPVWLPGPDHPDLPINELHIWRVRIEETEEPRWSTDWSTDDDSTYRRDRAEALRTALFRQDVIERYTGGDDGLPCIIRGPAAGLRVAMAQCDHLALIAISRNVRQVGLDVERVRPDIPFEEMADGFLDSRSQWDLRVTWSQREKAWKFFQIWTSNEACAQARRSARSNRCCQVRGFSPEADFVAALAVEGGPDIELLYWDWEC